MNVVNNTSPLTNLAAIGQFHLLHILYDKISIAVGVWEELNAYPRPWPGRSEVANADWVDQKLVKNQQLVNALRRDLDQGEAESIALALELKADFLLLDEKDGRHAAQRLGLRVVGVLGVLLEAKKKGHINKIKPHLDNLRYTAGFYISDDVYHSVLNLAGE